MKLVPSNGSPNLGDSSTNEFRSIWSVMTGVEIVVMNLIKSVLLFHETFMGTIQQIAN
jgi:hypothetical protein